MEILLASQSPRRRELLAQIGVQYRVISVDVPEHRAPDESGDTYVRRLALEKARAGRVNHPQCVVMGADTIVCCDDKVLEKPENFGDFQSMMKTLSGRQHEVKTAVAMCDDQQEVIECSTSSVAFRPLSDAEIQHYWASGEPQDKAGGYGIQGKGAAFVTGINGSYSGIVGLPIEKVVSMMREFQFPTWFE